MEEISDEEINLKENQKEMPKIKQSLDTSNNSQNLEDLLFSSNFLSDFVSKTIPNKTDENQKMFDLDLGIKKKLFSSQTISKRNKKRLSEVISTEPNSLGLKSRSSSKKKGYFFSLISKEKRKKKELSKFAVNKEENNLYPEKKERTDIYGNVISKKNKKNVRLSFIDNVTTQPLVNAIEIESFKNYNFLYGPREEKIEKTPNCKCQTCIIF